MRDINGQLDAGVDLLEGLLVKKAGLVDAVGLVDGLYPGAAAAGFRNFPESTEVTAPRISEVYTKGTLTLARLGREAPIAMANPAGPVLRNVEGGSLAARELYPDVRHTSPEALPRSPVIGTDSPVQYEQRDDIGAPRKRLPSAEPWSDGDHLYAPGVLRRSGTAVGPSRRRRRCTTRGSRPELELAGGPPPALGLHDRGARHVQLDDRAGVGAQRHGPEPRVLTRERPALRDERARPQTVGQDRGQALPRRSVVHDHRSPRSKGARVADACGIRV